MTRTGLIAHPELTLLTAFAGLMFGLAYFAALKRSVTLLVGSKNSWLGPLALTLGRVGAAVSFLLIAAKLGAAPLLGGFGGFLVARALALRAERKAG
ncbi:ATP synthase subunit I [Bradyrhizobium sp. CCBAU 51627]|uniref:ATP synthase subunit I n=1 Tax=Bradyrhizobium sp. CCBAU 51627 TaxID=1325088 RepID=UPI0023058BEF|nr:ATP synthase subunit I [Bradyrhizobium sp. CCBAU 51627]MDA9436874.1 hypothetical protein [Bradyrhizobium sp. CCBAU 51627]